MKTVLYKQPRYRLMNKTISYTGHAIREYKNITHKTVIMFILGSLDIQKGLT